jgi:hypothetical protein
MAETISLALAVLALLALCATLGLFCHGLYARRQMKRYKKQSGCRK